MSNFTNELTANPERLVVVKDFVLRLKTRASGIPARYSEAGRNFEEETNLPGRFWEDLSDLLLRTDPALSLPAFEEVICLLCRSHQRKGPPNNVARTNYGRAIKKTDFVSALMADGLPRSKAEQKAAELTRVSAHRARRMLRFKQLGNYLMWSTYCEECDCDDPFLPRMEPEQLVDSLGLPFNRGNLFLLFVYEIPTTIDRLVPTIADAYGKSFFFAFRPGGRTHPIRNQNLSGRPEIVHEPITGRFLSSSVKLIYPEHTSATTA